MDKKEIKRRIAMIRDNLKTGPSNGFARSDAHNRIAELKKELNKVLDKDIKLDYI